MAIFRSIHDPGLGEKYLDNNTRIINKDGSFNVQRKGLDTFWQNTYYFLINMSWTRFLALIFSAYVLINVFFGLIYWLTGVEHLRGAENHHEFDPFFNALFFSFQTFTSLGYGGMVPEGMVTNIISVTEAFVGLSSFALITGLLYGRFSRPSSRILFSRNALIAPFGENDRSLQFRIVNRRHNVLMELESRVMLMCVDLSGQTTDRKYYVLNLQLAFIHFFALNWTLVHHINEDSPLYGMSEKMLKDADAEILILLKGFDDTFGQVVYQRYSYKYSEIVHGAKFSKPYSTDKLGRTVIDVNKIHDYELLKSEPETATGSMAETVN